MRNAGSIFVAVLGLGAFAGACGRQITPNPPALGAGGAPPGYMALFFNTSGPLNFSSYRYMLVFNTTGNGITPSTDTQQTNWAGYSFGLIALGNGISSSAEFGEFVASKNPHNPPAWLPLYPTPQQFSYNLDSNGSQTQFSLLVQKRIFAGIASPSPTPSSSPTPGPSLWTFNAFTVQGNPSDPGQWYFVDSLGTGGPNDPQFVSPRLCMTEPFDYIRYGSYPANDPSADIYSIEIANNPVSPSPCP
jgi:hypothetical protein